MGNNRKLQYAIRAAIAMAGATAAAPAAFSQTAAATEPAAELQEVVVTGSRIQQNPNDISISPVVSVTALEIAQTGLVRTEDLLNNLPQVVAENSSGQSISSNGTATVSLRGLGSQRTLVLINGTRMAPGAGLGTSASPDINQIPTAMIQRVDVLTGGASAVYGADAVAGVVNFIMDTHFQGVRLDADYGYNSYKNSNQQYLGLLAAAHDQIPPGTTNAGANRSASFLAGSNFADGKGNATVYFTYMNTSPAIGYQYDYAGCTLNTPGALPTTPAKNVLKCGGSSSSATGRFLELGVKGTSNFSTYADGTVDKTTGQFRKYTAADSYNYGALSYLQRQADRYTAGAFLNYDVSDYANVYSEFMFARNTSQAQYGPSGLFAFGKQVISCTQNPLLTPSELAALCTPAGIAGNQATFGPANAGGNPLGGNPNVTGSNILLYMARRSVESGGRLDNYYSNAFREVLGVKGKFAEAWSYNAYGQVSITQVQDIEGDFLGTPQINNALNVVTAPGTGGATGVPAKAVCAAAVNGDDPKCVPWNIWTPGGVTQAQLNYLQVQSTYAIQSTEFIVHADATGDFGKYGIKIPTAASGLVANLGAEYREEKYQFAPDYIYANGFNSGGNGVIGPINNGFHVSEVFTEATLPIMDDQPFGYALSLNAGYRYSSYTDGFDTNTWKVGLEWAPIRDIRFRGGFNRAVRAPSIGELYAPNTVGAGGTADPCWGPAVGAIPGQPGTGLVNGHTFAFCANTGVTAAEFGHIIANPAAQINTQIGGATAVGGTLTPEIADTYTAGFVFQPSFLPNFVASIDYYNIKISDTITSLSSNTIINNCGLGQTSAVKCLTGSAGVAPLIQRGPGTGSLWFNTTNFVVANDINIGTVSTKGVDVAVHYLYDMGAMGKLTTNLAGTYVNSFDTQPTPSSGTYDCVGYFGTTCLAPLPKWRHVLGTTWATPWWGADLTLRWRYIGPSNTDRSSQDPQLAQTYFQGTSHIGGYTYLDFSASIPIGSAVSFRVGMNNIADKAPPVVANGNYSDCPNTSCNDNTWVGTYDTMGRYIYAHIQAKF
jgi:iron complex outermembrane recepter protein